MAPLSVTMAGAATSLGFGALGPEIHGGFTEKNGGFHEISWWMTALKHGVFMGFDEI
jgi:hypothetical protein